MMTCIQRFAVATLAALVCFSYTPAQAARFSGGMCASQGNWLQDALKQSHLIVDALETLKNDPNCKVLSQALEQLPKVNASAPDSDSQASFANTFRELSALNDYMNPARLGSGLDKNEFQRVVFDVVFNKSYSAIKDLNNQMSGTYTEGQKESVRNVSVRLKNFLEHSEQIANATMGTARSILNALPDSERCLHNKPSASAVIFGAVAHSAAALVSGGEMNGVGEFASALLNYSRNMSYVKSLKPIELEEFKNSVYCLVESTSESYCAVQDAEDSLEMLKKTGGKRGYNLNTILDQSAGDPVASPLAGLVIYMRDIPVVQAWLEKVLMGLAPRTSWQGQGKNDNWAAYLGFIQSVNSLQANFRDKEQQYYYSTSGKDRMTKIGQIHEIFTDTLDILRGEHSNGSGGGTNFFARTMETSQMPFFLLGQQMPADFNTQTNNFENFWLKWSREGSNGFDNPDRILQGIRDNLWKLMEKAQVEANALFASRMLVDPQNLATEAMRGPGTSAYQAFFDQRVYYSNLMAKLDAGSKELQKNPREQLHSRQLRAYLPLLRDSVDRLDKVIAALNSIGDVDGRADSSSAQQSEKIMNVIYEAGNMLVSWDSFFGTRMQTALQADLSDTLWRKSPISDQQRQYLLSVGPEIVQRLSGLFANNPVSQRTDLNSAKITHIANLKAVEEQFGKVLFNEVLSLDCKLEGGYPCEAMSLGTTYDPASTSYSERDKISGLNRGLVASRTGSNYFQRFYKWWYKPTDDAIAFIQVRAKLCMQALAFNSRTAFSEVCRGAVLESEFADKSDEYRLNLSFDDQLSTISAIGTGNGGEKIDRARGAGVCSYRTYLRKNHVFFMYRDFNSDNARQANRSSL